jgi:hypothetical protein
MKIAIPKFKMMKAKAEEIFMKVIAKIQAARVMAIAFADAMVYSAFAGRGLQAANMVGGETIPEGKNPKEYFKEREKKTCETENGEMRDQWDADMKATAEKQDDADMKDLLIKVGTGPPEEDETIKQDALEGELEVRAEPEETLEEFEARADTDGDGEIDAEEFAAAFAAKDTKATDLETELEPEVVIVPATDDAAAEDTSSIKATELEAVL